MEKWIIRHADSGEAGFVCHFEGPIGGDYTLCGLSLEHDPDLYLEAPKPVVYGKVNCPECKTIVAAVRKIKGNEIEND